MENYEKCPEMFLKKRKMLKFCKYKIVLQIRKSAEKVLSAIGTGRDDPEMGQSFTYQSLVLLLNND